MSVCEAIKHYQRSIEKSTGNDERILHCIEKLYRLPVTVIHLQETGVGRTVNGLRKFDGEVGTAAKALVAKWKAMVAEEESSASEEEFQVSSTNDNGRANEDSIDDENMIIDETNISDNEILETTSTRRENHKSSHKSKEDRRRSTSHKSEKKEKNREDERNLKRKANHDDRSRSSKKHRDRETASSQKISIKQETLSDNDSENSEPEYKQKKEHITKEKHKSKSESTSSSSKSRDRSTSSSKSKHREEKDKSHNKSDKKSHKSDRTEETLKKSSILIEENKFDLNKVKDEHARKSSREASSSSSKDSSSSVKEKLTSRNVHCNAGNLNGSTKKEKVIKKENNTDEDFIDSYSGPSFAEALGMIGSGKSPKKKPVPLAPTNMPASTSVIKPSTKSSTYKSVPLSNTNSPPPPQRSATPVLLTSAIKLPPLDLDLSTLPTISTNYRPLPYNTLDECLKPSLSTQHATASGLGTTSKNQRTKVYSGNKGSLTHVPSLYELCIRLLQENIDAVEYTGGVPYDILRPVLERASPDQLFSLEHHNPYLIEESDPLWEFHCKKKFRGHPRLEMEGWRETYLRCQDEQEAKLKSLTANIKQSQQVKTAPVRKAKLAYMDSAVKPPRNIAKKQAQYGTARALVVTPAARVASLSGTNSQIARAGDSRLKVSATARDPAQTSSSYTAKPKRAPLMQKTLAFMMKGRFKR